MEYVFGDFYDIAGRVKEIDPALVVSFDEKQKEYHIKRNQHRIMSVERGQLDPRVLTKLRKGDLQRRRLEDFIYELERSEDEAERSRARELSNTIESMTLEQYDRTVGIPHYSLGHWDTGRGKNDT